MFVRACLHPVLRGRFVKRIRIPTKDSCLKIKVLIEYKSLSIRQDVSFYALHKTAKRERHNGIKTLLHHRLTLVECDWGGYEPSPKLVSANL
jgi:hypothetical protein